MRTTKAKHKHKKKSKNIKSHRLTHVVERSKYAQSNMMNRQTSAPDPEKIRRSSGGSVRDKARSFVKTYGNNYGSSSFIQDNPDLFNTKTY